MISVSTLPISPTKPPTSRPPLDDFSLSSESAGFIEEVGLDVARWQPPVHLGRHRPALILLAGERFVLPELKVQPDTTMLVEFARGLPTISNDGMTLTFSAVCSGSPRSSVTVTLTNDDAPHVRTLRYDLGHLSWGDTQLIVEAGAGPLGDPCADWAALISLVVGPEDALDLLKARSFRELRIANEMAHFASAYDHPLYAERDRNARGECPIASPVPLTAARTGDELAPRPQEHVFTYATRMLQKHLRHRPPDFASRLRLRRSGNPLRVASLCAGTAQVEASILRGAQVPVEITLVDISDKLLEQARRCMPENVTTRLLIQDVNELDLEPNYYDVVACVSGIHHAVELERIWRNVRNALRRDGELWLIGEQIGPNGNRLARPDYAVANEVFRSLPGSYRHNAHTGVIDDDLPNVDCSEATFEGIRSQDIEHTAERFFLSEHAIKRNCFLWRLLNQAYSGNYDLAVEEDWRRVLSLVQAELDHFRNGGTPVELFAVYRPNW